LPFLRESYTLIMQKHILIAALFALGLPALSAQAEDKVDFEKQIWPIIENSCLKCHQVPFEDERGRMRKPKSGLIIGTKEGMMAGGDEGDAIVPGKPDDSPFYTMTTLSLDDELHMPPEDKADQLTTEEKELLKTWIAQGADYGSWVKYEGEPK